MSNTGHIETARDAIRIIHAAAEHVVGQLHAQGIEPAQVAEGAFINAMVRLLDARCPSGCLSGATPCTATVADAVCLVLGFNYEQVLFNLATAVQTSVFGAKPDRLTVH